MSSFNNVPHIYFQKKYITLNRQDLNRGVQSYFYTGGNGISGCIAQLNNVNSITSGCLILLSHICYKLGIKNPIVKDELDDRPTYGLQDLLPSSSESPLKKDLEDMNKKLIYLNEQINLINEKIGNFDKSILEKILKHAESVDQKT